ncbi:MAG: DUF1284 domain-containing protein [Armatimonadetes bacterium]|nr:DUF1284 domain-containing protein [Armatimonadota bacterium]
MSDSTPVHIRPYQLACLICRAGSDEPAPTDDRIAELGQLIREHPDTPLMLCANIGDAYAWQDPGPADDTPEGLDFNRKRDLDILQRLDMAPGWVLPARVLIKRLLLRMPTVAGVCGYDTVTGPGWQGCPRARSGDYERGAARGFAPHIPPRPDGEMAADKERSLAAMEQAETVRIRPHIIACAVCQYGGGTRPPFKEDNLPEFLQKVLAGWNPQVELVPGADWDMCAPCPHRSAEGFCVTGRVSGAGVYNEMKDLEVMQAVGMTYGDTMPAHDIFRLILERIPTADGVCALTKVDAPVYSVWKDGCSSNTFPGAYEQGRELLWEAFGCAGTP